MVLNMGTPGTNPGSSRWEKWTDILVDAAITGGIAGLATGFLVDPAISWKVGLGAFLMAFLVKLKELRGIK